MKTTIRILRGHSCALLMVLVVVNLAGCATCRESSGTSAARPGEETPMWKLFCGWLLDCAAYSAYDYGASRQSAQSGDPAR